MNITEQLAEAKTKIEALAKQAVLVTDLQTEVENLKIALDESNSKLSESHANLAERSTEVEKLTAEKEEFAAKVIEFETDKRAVEAQAAQMLADLGFKAPVEVDRKENNKLTADEIRAKYASIEDSYERGVFYAEYKDEILSGIVK